MTKHGYLMFNYGNDKYFQDTALKRYTRYHNGGSTWIFNSCFGGNQNYTSCGCGGGIGSVWGFGSGWGCGCGGGFSWSNILGFGVGALCVGLAFKGIQSLCNGGWDTVKGWFEKKPADKTEKPVVKPEEEPAVKPGVKSEAVSDGVTPGVKSEAVSDGVTPLVTPTEPTDDQVKIGEKIIDIDSITLDDIPENEINNLDAAKVVKILTKLGYIVNGVGKMSGEYKVLLLLQKSGVNVKCATNPNSTDAFIQGKISDVELVGGKVKYSIDNSTAEGDYKFKYWFQEVEQNGQNQKVFHLTKISKNGSSKTGYVEKNWKAKDYVLTSEKEPLSTTGDPLVSANSSNTRTKLEEELV